MDEKNDKIVIIIKNQVPSNGVITAASEVVIPFVVIILTVTDYQLHHVILNYTNKGRQLFLQEV